MMFSGIVCLLHFDSPMSVMNSSFLQPPTVGKNLLCIRYYNDLSKYQIAPTPVLGGFMYNHPFSLIFFYVSRYWTLTLLPFYLTDNDLTKATICSI